MMKLPLFSGGVWLVDFEFHPLHGKEGNPPFPVCMVAHDLISNRTLRLWRDELVKLSAAPFPTDESALLVAYYSSAEIGCFLTLGWATPVNVLDLYICFRIHTNQKKLPCGNKLIGALAYFGLNTIAAEEKMTMQNLVLRCGPWSPFEQEEILDYCESDVTALEALLSAMAENIDWPRALFQSQYAVAAAHMESTGIPIDCETLNAINERWGEIQASLISIFDQDFHVFEGSTFKSKFFENYLIKQNISWPRLPTGRPDLKEDTFKDMCRTYPQLFPLRELRSTLSKIHKSELSVGGDGRNRCLLSIFQSKTGRNQPSTGKYIFGRPAWMRGLIIPRPGFGLAYIDWSQQEFGVAAALSGDQKMMAAYNSGDPYLEFAKQAGAAPSNATKSSHKIIRDQFKATVLAVQYGMGEESLAYRLNQPVVRARQLLELHRRTYRVYWLWCEGIINQALLGGQLWTTFGWQMFIEEKPNLRSLTNFPMQGNGAEMLRLACVWLTKAGIRVCGPIHDAVLIEAPLPELENTVRKAQLIMRQASSAVLDGFELSTDVKLIRWPYRYMDERGAKMWNLVMEHLGRHHCKVPLDMD